MIAFFAALLPAAHAWAWTKARVSIVRTTVAVADHGPSTVTTEVTFVVEGGRLKGFDLAPKPGYTLDTAASFAHNGRGRHPVRAAVLYDGRTRVTVRKPDGFGRGTATFTLVHRVDLAAIGALRSQGNRVHLSVTPFQWKHSAEQMITAVVLPQGKRDPHLAPDPQITEPYEILERSARRVVFRKMPAVKWYAMQVAVSFDADVVGGVSAVPPAEAQRAPAEDGTGAVASHRPGEQGGSQTPPWWLVAVLLVGVGGLHWRKNRWVARVHAASLEAPRYRVLSHTGGAVRWALTALGLATAGYAVCAVGAAAGVPPLAAVSALWLVRTNNAPRPLRPGGTWRKLTPEEVEDFAELERRYRRTRRSWLDGLQARGVVGLGALVAVGSAVTYWSGRWGAQAAVTVALITALGAVPVWFSCGRHQVAPNPLLSGLALIRKWEHHARRTLAADGAGDASYWLREDAAGPIEIRLFLTARVPGLQRVEVGAACEGKKRGFQTALLVVVRTDPGASLAQEVARWEAALEHHLAPDRRTELVVVYSRRGARDRRTTMRRTMALLQRRTG